MSTPITQSLFKPTDFDLFVDEIGLTDLSPRSRIELVDSMTSAVEYRVVTEIFRKMSDDDQLKLVDIMRAADESGSDAEVNSFLLERIPDIEALVDEVIEDVKNSYRLSTAGIKATIDEEIARTQKANEYAEQYYKKGDDPDTLNDSSLPDLATGSLEDVAKQSEELAKSTGAVSDPADLSSNNASEPVDSNMNDSVLAEPVNTFSEPVNNTPIGSSPEDLQARDQEQANAIINQLHQAPDDTSEKPLSDQDNGQTVSGQAIDDELNALKN